MKALVLILRNALAFLAACAILAGVAVYGVEGWRGWESAAVVLTSAALLPAYGVEMQPLRCENRERQRQPQETEVLHLSVD